MSSNNYKFKSINFPNQLPLIFVNQIVIGITSIPNGAIDLDLISDNVILNTSGRIICNFSSSIKAIKNLAEPPVSLSYSLIYNNTQFLGSEKSFEYGAPSTFKTVLYTSGVSSILTPNTYNIKFRILTSFVDQNSTLEITPEGVLTIFKTIE